LNQQEQGRCRYQMRHKSQTAARDVFFRGGCTA
jgi:hypothetical protein